MVKKNIAVFLIFILLVIFIAKEIRIRTIDDLAYVVAIGLDSGDNDILKVSFQIANTSSNSSSDSSENSSNSTISTIETSSIDNAINLMNTYISKEVSLAHCKAIVISEDLASKGISSYLYTLINKMEISPKCNIIISRVNTDYFLKEASLNIEKNTTKFYEIIPTTANYTGYTDTITLRDFFSRMGDTFAQPYTILGNVNVSNDNNSSYQNDGVNVSNNVQSPNKVDISGIAVFNADTMVGQLNSIETICHLILSNKLENSNITIPSPFSNTDTIDLSINLKKSTKIDVENLNGSPYVKSNVYINARILTMTKNSDYMNSKNLSEIEEYTNSYLESQIYNYFYKTSKEYKSDILGLGKYVVDDFLTWDEWVDYDWLTQYENAFFDVSVQTDVKSGYLLLET